MNWLLCRHFPKVARWNALILRAFVGTCQQLPHRLLLRSWAALLLYTRQAPASNPRLCTRLRQWAPLIVQSPHRHRRHRQQQQRCQKPSAYPLRRPPLELAVAPVCRCRPSSVSRSPTPRGPPSPAPSLNIALHQQPQSDIDAEIECVASRHSKFNIDDNYKQTYWQTLSNSRSLQYSQLEFLCQHFSLTHFSHYPFIWVSFRHIFYYCVRVRVREYL